MRILRTLREKAGYTQEQLARMLKVDRTTVAKWETGAANPEFSKIKKIAEALECSINDLFSEDSGTNE